MTDDYATQLIAELKTLNGRLLMILQAIQQLAPTKG